MSCRNYQVFALGVCILGAAVSARAEEQVILGVANNSGRQTRVAITNRSATSAEVTLSVVAGDPGSSPDPKVITIAPLSTQVYGDAFGEIWQLTDQQGVLRVASSQALLISAARYVSSGDGGRVGSPLPIVSEQNLVGAGGYGDLPWIGQDADPSTGLASNIAIYIAQPGTEADVVVFNSDGAQVAIQTIKTGPAWRQIPLSSLVSTELKVARAELRVKSGSATALSELIDGPTGRAIPSALLTDGAATTDFALGSAFHNSALGVIRLRTDLRLFNPGRTAARIVARFGSGSYTTDLAPKALLEVGDALGSLFGAEDGAQGLIQFQSSIPVDCHGA